MSCPHCAKMVAEIQQLKDKIRQLEVDVLTGFLLRGVGMSQIMRIIPQRQAAVFFVDVDNLHDLNLPENGSHENGDRALRIISSKLRTLMRPTDIFVRYGGDEFVIVAPGMSLDVACFRARLIIKEIRKESLSVTIGVCTSREAETADLAIKRADEIQTVGKKAGKGRVYTGKEQPHVSGTYELQCTGSRRSQSSTAKG